MNHLYIQMLGDFTLKHNDSIISDRQNRTKKIWILLSYIIYKRGQILPRRELINLLWAEDASSTNPENALKITFHRVRTLLDQLEPSAGHQLILWQDNGYTWNPDIPMTLDIEQFELLCTSDYEDETAKLESYLEALSLYQGDFLSNLPKENWILPVSTHYHTLYIDTVLKTVPLLSKRGKHEAAILILKKAIATEPYSEPLFHQLMHEHIQNNDPSSAISAYETLTQRMMNDLGIKPDDRLYETYRKTMQSVTNKSLTMEHVLDSLFEKDSYAGALRCDYDYFKVLCHSESRISARSGNCSHIVLMTILEKEGKLLTKSKLDQIMQQLGENIRLSLRRGDAYTQCSVNQYVIMLREANYENSCMVAKRIVTAFTKSHPRTAVEVVYQAELLAPTIIMQ